jgi:hypothetical protein
VPGLSTTYSNVSHVDYTSGPKVTNSLNFHRPLRIFLCPVPNKSERGVTNITFVNSRASIARKIFEVDQRFLIDCCDATVWSNLKQIGITLEKPLIYFQKSGVPHTPNTLLSHPMGVKTPQFGKPGIRLIGKQ